MFIATMFSYGKDTECVGVDGIVGCMGVFLAYRQMLYAIHVPDNPLRLDMGRDAFVTYVKQQAPGFIGDEAQLYSVLNGDNRPGAAAEMAAYCRDLFVGRVTIYRLRKFLGAQGSSQDSAAVLCEFIPQSTDCRLKYQRTADVQWTKNVGTVRAGFYFNNSMIDVLSANAAPSAGWHLADENSCTIETKDFF